MTAVPAGIAQSALALSVPPSTFVHCAHVFVAFRVNVPAPRFVKPPATFAPTVIASPVRFVLHSSPTVSDTITLPWV